VDYSPPGASSTRHSVGCWWRSGTTSRAPGHWVPAHQYKIVAFVLSAFLAGLGGGLFAVAHGFVALDTLHWTTSGKAVVVVVLGGIGTLWGGVVGAALLVRLEDWPPFSRVQQIGLVTGVIFVAVVLLFRQGLLGPLRQVLRRRGDAVTQVTRK